MHQYSEANFISLKLFTFTLNTTDSFFEDTLQDRGFDIILYVFIVDTRARRDTFGDQALSDASLVHASCVHRTPRAGAELVSFTYFLFACLNCNLYLFIQVQEDAKQSSVWHCCL